MSYKPFGLSEMEVRAAGAPIDVNDIDLDDHDAVLAFIMQDASDGDRIEMSTPLAGGDIRRASRVLGLGDGLMLVEETITGQNQLPNNN